MKFGDRIRTTITHLDDKGCGRGDGMVVPFTAPGDVVEATCIKRHRGINTGRLETVTTPSPDRVPTPCPHAGVCGGCLWQHLDDTAQRRLKCERINAAFAEAGHLESIETVIPSCEQLFYRNRMDYAIGWKGEVGLKEYGSWNRYVDLSTCLLLDQETPRLLATVRDLMRDLPLEPWNAKTMTGQVRYVVIRLGKKRNERMITLIVKHLGGINDQTQQEIVKRLNPFATSLYLGENPLTTDLSFAQTLLHLAGNEFLTEEINGLSYRILPNTFFQTNSPMAAILQTTVLDMIGDMHDTTILDLYCGVGFFGIACAKRGATVYGHELDAEAIALARVNAVLNGVDKRTTFGAGPVERLDDARLSADVAIVDPPRAGLHPRAIETLLRTRPKTIIYVSCNYRRLATELMAFKQSYRVDQLVALDLFPQTPHVEVLARLMRND